MTFLFDSESDSYHISSRFAFPDYYMRSSQIWRWCHHFRLMSCDRFKDDHLAWCFSSMLWCSSYLHRGYIEFRSLHFILDVLDAPLAIKWHAFMLFILGDPAMPSSISVGPPCLFVDLNTFSCDKNRYSHIELLHDLLAPYNSCLLVILENQPLVHLWLVDELSRVQTCLELCRFA
jgi:hypothetical protein